MSEEAKKTVLITGASSGIGADMALEYAARGCDLVLIARRLARLQALAEKLSETYGVKCHTYALDLLDPTAPENLLEQLRKDGIQINILVNNAGFGARGSFVEISLEKQLDMIQLNITSLTALTRLFVRSMFANREGQIINVASTAAFQPGPFMAVYYATKAYVLSFSEALNNELQGTGVTVTCLCPGATKTEFAEVAEMEESVLFRDAATMDSKTVAKQAVAGAENGKAVVIPGLLNRMMAFSVRFTPRPILLKIIRKLQAN